MTLRPRSSIITHHEKNERDKEHMDVLRQARQAIKQTQSKASRMQSHTTQELFQRVKDVKYWSAELEREIQEITDDTTELIRHQNRLQRCLGVTNNALGIVQKSANFRQKEIQSSNNNYGQDKVTAELRKESKMVADSQRHMKELFSEINKQFQRNESVKVRLRRDWSLKNEAISLDARSAAMANENVLMRGMEKDFADEKALLLSINQKMVDQQEWMENTVSNLNISAKARVSTRKLTQTVITNLRDLSQGMRAQANVVDASIKDHLKILGEHREGIASQIRAKDKEIRNTNLAVSELELALKQKTPTYQIALNRQNQRTQRPGIELCHDKAQAALDSELALLRDSISQLHIQFDKSKKTRSGLLHEKERLLARQEVLEHNTKIYNDTLRKIRYFYPQEIQLTGFMLVDKKFED